MQEVWKPIPGYSGLYEVSNLGRVKSLYRVKGLICKPRDNGKGYLYVQLYAQGRGTKKYIHRLVVIAHIGAIPEGTEVNHKDGVKHNNAVTNLEVTTAQGNNFHAHKLGLTPKPGVSVYHNVHTIRSRYKNKTYTYYVAKVKDNYKVIYWKQFTCEIEAAKAVDAFLDSISDTQRQRNFPKP